MPGLEDLRAPDSKRKLLVVEDDDLNREMLCALLEGDYETIVASNGREGFELLREHHEELSLVLLDVYMPECDGFEFLRLRQGDERYANVPVIVTTGSDAVEDEIECLRLGANDFVLKPYNIEIIANRVRNTIRLRESASIVNQLRWDKLTGLYRLEFFMRRVDNLLAAYPEHAYDFVLSDVRNFKALNDRYGHDRCDQLLHDLADRFVRALPGLAVAGRAGGDSFAFLVEHAERDWKAQLEPSLEGLEIASLFVRFGVVSNVDHSMTAAQLADRATMAIDELRDSVGIGVAFYDEVLRERQAMERLIIENMESALADGQFSVYFQPKHDVHTGRVAGAEALVRWLHPELGFIRPDLFITVLERNGLIAQLDRFVCNEACKEIARMRRLGLPSVPISINVSPLDFDDHDLPQRITAMADEHGIEHRLLHVEITETAYSEDPENVVRALDELRAHGFKIELDDFGSGYSSLALLNTLPIDIMKIDGAMVRAATLHDDFRIIQSAIQIAQFLGLETVIEGVETDEALQHLRLMGCDLIQGFYYSWPLRRDDFEEYLLEH